jgi:hypothetical protein
VKTYMVTDDTALRAVLRNVSSTAAMDGFYVLYDVQYVKTGIIDTHEMIYPACITCLTMQPCMNTSSSFFEPKDERLPHVGGQQE